MPLPGSEMTLASSPEMQIEIVGKFIPSAKSVAGEATPTVDTTPFGTYDERQPCHHASAVALYFPAKCAAPAPICISPDLDRARRLPTCSDAWIGAFTGAPQILSRTGPPWSKMVASCPWLRLAPCGRNLTARIPCARICLR